MHFGGYIKCLATILICVKQLAYIYVLLTIPKLQLLQNLTTKIHGQGHACGQRSRSHLTLKIKVKVMAKVKSTGQIWGLDFNRYICFSFLGNRTIFGWNIAKVHNWPWKFKVKVIMKIDQNLTRSFPTILRKLKEIQKVVRKLSSEK